MNFLEQVAEMIDSRIKSTDILSARLQNSEKELRSRNAKYKRDLNRYLRSLSSQEDFFNRRLDKVTKERDSSVQALQGLRARKKVIEDANHELRLVINQQGDEIKRYEEELLQNKRMPGQKS